MSGMYPCTMPFLLCGSRYTFQPIREIVGAIREAGRPVTVRAVAARAGLQECPVPRRQQALDQQRQQKPGSPQRERRSPQRGDRDGDGAGDRQAAPGTGAGTGGRGGGSTIHEVQQPVNTVALAILAHLAAADPTAVSTNWTTISRIYARGDCTLLIGAGAEG